MKTVPLRRMTRLINGGTPTPDPANWDGDVRWATPVDLARVDGATLTHTERTLTQAGLVSGSSEAPIGSVLLSTRAPIGYTAMLDYRVAFNQGCKALVPSGGLDARFLQLWLDSSRLDLQAAGSGSTFKELSSEVLMAFRIPLRVIDEQRRIADFLDDRVSRIDNIIAARRQQIESRTRWFAAAVAGRVETEFSRYGRAPVRRFVAGIEQGDSPVASDRPAESGEWGVLKTSSIKQGRFDPAMNKALDLGARIDLAFEVHEGDLVVTRGSGSAALVGDVAVARLGGTRARLLLSDLTYRLREPTMSPDYLADCLLSPQGRSDLRARVRQGSGPAKARGEDILSLAVPPSPVPAQAEMVKEISQLRMSTASSAEVLMHSISLLAEYKQSLITAAVTGELDVTAARKAIPA